MRQGGRGCARTPRRRGTRGPRWRRERSPASIARSSSRNVCSPSPRTRKSMRRAAIRRPPARGSDRSRRPRFATPGRSRARARDLQRRRPLKRHDRQADDIRLSSCSRRVDSRSRPALHEDQVGDRHAVMADRRFRRARPARRWASGSRSAACARTSPASTAGGCSYSCQSAVGSRQSA